MIGIEINGKQYNVPVSFSEITVGDYCRCFYGLEKTDGLEEQELFLATKRNESRILSRLLGEDDDFCLSMPLPVYASLSQSCSFIYGIDGLKRSRYITIGDKRYMAPEPKEMNLRQWIDLDVTLQEEDNPDKFIHILSMILLEVGEDGKAVPYKGFDDGLVGKLKGMKASDGLGIIYHFFVKGAISSMLTRLYSTVGAVMDPSRQNTQSS